MEVRARLRRRKKSRRVGRGSEKRVLTEIRGSSGRGNFSSTESFWGGVIVFSSASASAGGLGTLGRIAGFFAGWLPGSEEKTMSSISDTSFSTSSRKGKNESTTESRIPWAIHSTGKHQH